ncbi:hypothetical protein LZ578_02060 [Jeotgalibaca sp. MA1X17-3]|uniref:hypothetical protein n=1 Tax=Jeotgalibaca sp. MA1X17-3 TaxID=2908211 RepID=UPI001F1C8335|nr:hypothetical protein [Jeotgalibaca sp. MA1X17-3]UJF15952.1 hypothetical protein LZ578_02060 [Jeotgalibaca sp. MA1X17-3]
MSKKINYEKGEKIVDTVRIEEVAVGHLNTIINEYSEKLKGDIPINDKGVSFDGSIILTKGNTILKVL